MEAYQQLEHEWSSFNNLDPKGMVCCSSGTAALHLALEAFRLPPGSGVLVPDFTMIACPRAVTLAGLTPVFVDCGDDLNMDMMLVPKAMSSETMVAMLVHVYGRRCPDVRRVPAAKGNMLPDHCDYVVEDLAEAHGIKPHEWTDAACWSFYRNKIVAGEEGGAVWFRDPDHAALARQLRSLGFTEAHDFMHVPRGHNYRMSNLHASWILGESDSAFTGVCGGSNPNGLPRVNVNLKLRKEIEGWYDEACTEEWRMPPRDAPWVYDLRLRERGMSVYKLQRVVTALNDAGIAARTGFRPMTEQMEYRGCQRVTKDAIWNAWQASREVFYLPIQPGKTTQADVRRSFEVIRSITG